MAVVCQELGCGEAQGLDGELPHFGPGVGHIWLDDVRCQGQERSLQDCAHRVWGYHDCTHREDVGVVCQVWGCHHGLVMATGPCGAGFSHAQSCLLTGSLSIMALAPVVSGTGDSYLALLQHLREEPKQDP
ncbi:hypothetical protein CIB84_017512 [Bambusicola thoracicus]|uniref:SRCR domain-containing protein n=1 Tax=Bambusicola thoracicus TaxID=9083 RepID=A0A2P4S3P0_BAMTH|nr:hypothetical protein CIB84_017512 [Bambusicola thoracicus]